MISIELTFTNHGPDDVNDIKIGSKVNLRLISKKKEVSSVRK